MALSLRATRIARHSWVKLIDDVEHSIFPAIVGVVLDKVVGPDVIAVLAAAGCMIHPKARAGRALGRLWGDLQPLAPPDTARPACR